MWNFLWAKRRAVAKQTAEQKKHRQRQQRRVFFESLETRTLMAADLRSIDGTGNNLANPSWGSAGTDLIRKAPAAYADGISAPVVGSPARPSAREISNVISDQGDTDIISDRQLSAMVYAWGQFLDHDLDLTGTASPSQSLPISVPKGDPQFDPAGTGTKTIPLSRSAFDAATGTSTSNPRQQVNSVTAWLDGSQIYGSDTATADKLRTHVGGHLKTSAGNLLPLNDAATFPTGTLPMANDSHLVPSSQLFAAGDVRANENIELSSLHTLFMREHNRVADKIAKENPTFSDEQIYQGARAWVIGELQVITYKEWLPTILGPQGLSPGNGYQSNVNPGIANEFSTAGFRFGHSMLGDDIEFLNNDGLSIDDAIPLSEGLFNPPELTAHGVDSIMKYLASDPASEIDTKVVGSVRNFLFGPPGAGGLDLVSLNIQRGRDHGIEDYNSMRQAYGLPKITSFEQITSDVATQTKLRTLYGNVNNIDAWVGALAEKHLPGASVGALMQRVLVDQFSRLRDGDRFWYQKSFSGAQLRDLEGTTLASVMRRNSGLTNLQDNVFVFKAEIRGTVFGDGNRDGRVNPPEQGLAKVTVELRNVTENVVVATTQTDPQGRYVFDVNSGLRTGKYQVNVVVPAGSVLTTPSQPVIAITQGDIFRQEVNFGIVPLAKPTTSPTNPPTKPAPHGGNLAATNTGTTGATGITSPIAPTKPQDQGAPPPVGPTGSSGPGGKTAGGSSSTGTATGSTSTSGSKDGDTDGSSAGTVAGPRKPAKRR